ncbi:hypothetical protein NL676_027917 [Syzygium grande]|nr:hypothetical protein NL676_027917 [Syzygium grande]
MIFGKLSFTLEIFEFFGKLVSNQALRKEILPRPDPQSRGCDSNDSTVRLLPIVNRTRSCDSISRPSPVQQKPPVGGQKDMDMAGQDHRGTKAAAIALPGRQDMVGDVGLPRAPVIRVSMGFTTTIVQDKYRPILHKAPALVHWRPAPVDNLASLSRSDGVKHEFEFLRPSWPWNDSGDDVVDKPLREFGESGKSAKKR